MVLKDFQASRVIKLHEGDNPLGMMGLVLREAKPLTNAGRMSCRVTISTSTIDRSGDEVWTKGIDLSDHKANPIVLLAHNKDMPVGFAEDRLGGYTVKTVGDNRLEAETFFSQSTEIGEQTFRLVENRVLRGASIGFLPVLGMVEKKHDRGTIYKAAKLVEYSHLPIPDNAECLVEAVNKGIGGKMLCADLLALLRPLCPERPATVVSGFQSAPSSSDTATIPIVSKTMPFPADTDQQTQLDPPSADPDAMASADDGMGMDADPNAEHNELVKNSLGDIIMSLVEQGLNGGEDAKSILNKIKHLFDTHSKLTDSGDDGELPDLGEDADVEDLEDDGADAESDDESDDDDDIIEKEKSYMAWSDEGAQWLTKGYKFLSALVATPKLGKAKVDKAAKELLAEMEQACRPVRKAIADGAIVKKTATTDEWREWETELATLSNRISGLSLN